MDYVIKRIGDDFIRPDHLQFGEIRLDATDSLTLG